MDVAHQQCSYLKRLRHFGIDVQQYWHLFSVFCEMLTAGGGLRSTSNWWPAARLWRIILTAQEAGYWDAETGVAPALLASFNDPPPPALHGLQLLLSHLQVIATLFSNAFAGNLNIGEELFMGRTPAFRRTTCPASAKGEGTGGFPDCPLAFSAEAITATVPDALLDKLVEPGIATRAWTTCLVLALLPHLQACWCLSNSSGPASSATLSDRARAWLVAQLNGDEDSLAQIMSTASSQLAMWAVAHDRLLTDSRAAHVATTEHATLLLNRFSGSLVYQLTTKHPTLKVMLSTDDFVGARRWETFALIVSTCIAVLMTAIWLYYSRSIRCCSDVRIALGCSPTAALPCRGFVGLCANLSITYYRFAAAGIALQERPLPPPLCTAFPDPDSARDQLVSGLISMLVALLIVGIFDTAFSLSMSTNEAQLHGRTHLKRWSLKAFALTGRAPWEHFPGWLHRAKFWWAGTWSNSIFAYALVAFVSTCASWLTRMRAWASWYLPPCKQCKQTVECKARSSEEQRDQRLIEEAALFSWVTDSYRRGAVFSLYCCWALCSYVIFVRTRHSSVGLLCFAACDNNALTRMHVQVYGKLVYELVGIRAEENFIRTWGIGLGIGQLHEARDMCTSIMEVALGMTVLEVLWMLSNDRWFEKNVDYVSVHATLTASAAASWLHRTVSYVRFYKCVRVVAPAAANQPTHARTLRSILPRTQGCRIFLTHRHRACYRAASNVACWKVNLA